MVNEIKQRLINMWRQLGFSLEENGISYSLIEAYAGAMGLVSDEYDGIFADLFKDSASVRGLAMLLDLMNAQSAQEDIGEYFSSTPKIFSKSEFEEAAAIFDYSIENNTFTFSYSAALSSSIINSISRFIMNYLPVYIAISADGSGLTFDEFDALGLSWRQIDAAALPFSVIDSLKNN
ncbi:MAG: hypothetical protein LUH82_05160 [Clostridiales bacterium]|nr:hypothetical protein [Clostridiales bacterium]